MLLGGFLLRPMLTTASPLFRARFTRVITPSIISSERRYYRPTSVVRSNGDNRKPPTTPPPSKPTNKSNDDSDNGFWNMNTLLSSTPQSPAQTAQAAQPRTTRGTQSTGQSKRDNELEEDEEEKETLEWMSSVRGLPKVPNMPIIQRGEEAGAEEESEVPEFSNRDEAKLAEAVEQAKRKEEKVLVQKYQKKGMWDDTLARELVDKALTEKRDELRTQRGRGEMDTPESATARNQKYKLGDVTLSIEHMEDATIRRHNEHLNEVASNAQELLERKEEEILADEDPELIDALLDRPSHIDKTIAGKKGEEILEFDSPEELAEFEANKGKLSDEKMTKSRTQIIENRKRGPAVTKNEDGADNITLLYDEEPPAERAVIQFKDPLKRLKFLPIYPTKVRKWVTYLRHCKGRYDKWGYWENDTKLQEQENKVREQLKVRARQLGDTGMLLMAEKRKRQILPPDLDGHYRFGVQPDELIGIHPKVKEMLSFRHANNTEIHMFRKQQQVKRWQERPSDHGTPQVQIACMTTRVNYLTDHLKKNKKDKQCRLSLRKLLSRRQSMLKYLRSTNVPIYYQIVRELDIQDVSY